jgi:copper(I)-binding protein
MIWSRRDHASPPTVRGSLEIRDAWARPSSTYLLQAGAYLTVTNNGPEQDRLLGGACPAATSIEIHAIKVVGANVKMQRLDEGLALPVGVAMTLKPRGYHLQLLGLGIPLRTGTRVSLTLTFEKAGSVDIELPVRSPGPIGNAVFDQPRPAG